MLINYALGNVNRDSKANQETVVGVLEILRQILLQIPSENIPKLSELYKCLMIGLFGADTIENIAKNALDYYAIVNDNIREKSYNLLLEVVKQLKKETVLFKFICEFYKNVPWRSYKSFDWNISSSQFAKNETGYVGLINMGSTCYLNSLIQQLFFIENLRDSIISFEESSSHPVLEEFQQLFGVLHEKTIGSFKPKSFCDSLGISSNMQEDVILFLDRLFDNLNKDLKNTKFNDLLTNLFEINLTTTISCKECNSVSKSTCSTHYLDLDVVHRKSLFESLQACTRLETLQGDNAYNCDICRKKVAAEKIQTVTKLPPVLIMHLKRFTVGSDGRSVKLNNFYEFPFELNMSHFSKENSNIYELKGVIVHSGLLDGGHYYSFVKEESNEKGEWLKFNDAKVSRVTSKELIDEAYGQKSENIDKSIPVELAGNYNNAYVLIYQTKMNQGNSAIMNYSGKLSKQMMKIREGNLMLKFIFNQAYENFVTKLCELAQTDDCYNFELVHLLTVAIRNSEISEDIYELFNNLKQACYKDVNLCKKIAALFAQREFVREFITLCPKEESRRLIVGLLKVVITKLYAYEMEIKKSLYVSAIISALLSEAKYLQKANCGQYFQLLSHIALLAPDMQKYFSANLLVGVAFEILGISTQKDYSNMVTLKFEKAKNELEDPLIMPSYYDDKISGGNGIFEEDCTKITPTQAKFVFELVSILIKDSLEILNDDFQKLLSNFADKASLGIMFKHVEISNKVGLNFLSKTLKQISEQKPTVFTLPIVNYLCYKIINEPFKTLKSYFRVIHILLKTDEDKPFIQIFNTVLNTMNEDIKKQKIPLTIGLAYADFIIKVFL